MRKIMTFVMLISLFSLGWMVGSSYAMDPMTQGSSRPYEASKLVGTHVKNPQGEYLGRIEDFIIDKDRIAFGILSHSGFLGMGGKFVAVPFGALSFERTGGYFILDISRERLESAPQFDRTRFASSAWAEDVYKFFGLQPYWTEGEYGEEISPTMEKSVGEETMGDFPKTGEEYLYEYQYLWP
jgi:sporulation protein YlmC with PRC-barrel domain